MKSSSIAKARGSITKNFHVPLENLRSDPRRTVPFVPGTFAIFGPEQVSDPGPPARCQAPLRSPDRNAGKSRPASGAAPGARHLCDPRIGKLANLAPAPGARHLCDIPNRNAGKSRPRVRCQAPVDAGKSRPRARCQAPLRSPIGMLANLAPAPGARHEWHCTPGVRAQVL